MTKTDYNFKSFKELQAEKARVHEAIHEEQSALLHNMLQVKEKFTPVNILLTLLRPKKNPSLKRSLVSNGIGFAANMLVGNRLGFLGRLLLPAITGNLANKVVENEEPITHLVKNIIGIFRKKKPHAE